MAWGVLLNKTGSRRKKVVHLVEGLHGEGEELIVFGHGNTYCQFSLGDIVAITVAELPPRGYGPHSRAITNGEFRQNFPTPNARGNEEMTLGRLLGDLKRWYRLGPFEYLVGGVSQQPGNYGLEHPHRINFYQLTVPYRGPHMRLQRLSRSLDKLWAVD